ncbi:hypothetical protein L6452_02570 [Arctium lappa]|uniref:Uncharacterized protein n=1 Tax=Arctium lappa TaxID=4217 RepID=A0ACB9FKP4_ARCLA|nr:hypothetical protein L6452_02570 [Arctium lappa]
MTMQLLHYGIFELYGSKLDELTKDVKETLPAFSSITTKVTYLSTKDDVIHSSINVVKTDTDSLYSLKTEVSEIKVVLATNSSNIATFQSSFSALSESVNSQLAHLGETLKQILTIL